MNAASDWAGVWGEIAPGSMFLVAGVALGTETHKALEAPFPTELGGVSLGVRVGNTTRNAGLLWVSPGEIVGILPLDVPPGDGYMSVSSQAGGESAPAPVHIVERSFGIFTQRGNGWGPAIVHNVSPEGEYLWNTFVDSARPGQVIVLWGTGLGLPAAGDSGASVEVLAGNKAARTLYAGPSGCCAGMDQIVFEVPAGTEGCFVPLAVRFGDNLSQNFATMSVAAQGGVCSDPHFWPASAMQRLQGGEVVRVGSIGMFMNPQSLAFSVQRHFSGQTFGLYWTGAVNPALPPFGSCIVTRGGQYGGLRHGFRLGVPLETGGGVRIEGGPLNLRGPRGDLIAPQEPVNYYLWDPGEYTLDNRAGTGDVGPFRALIRLPAEPFRWTNVPQGQEIAWSGPEIDSSQDLEITWSSGDPARQYVMIRGNMDDGVSEAPADFICTERADKGSFIVPAGILRSVKRIMQSENREVWPWRHILYLSVSGRSLPQRFEARGLDYGELYYDITHSGNFALK